MVHPRVNAHRVTYQRRAAGIKAALAQQERQQLANPELTDRQRRRNVQHLRDQAARQLAQLATDYEQGKAGVLAAIRRPLYKLPPWAMADVSFRDALDRAARQAETQEQAMMLWDRAALLGDEIQMLALAYLAAPDPASQPSGPVAADHPGMAAHRPPHR
jgi:hypothetical protein